MKYEQTHTSRYMYRRMGLVPIKQRKEAQEGLYGLLWAVLLTGMIMLPALLNLG